MNNKKFLISIIFAIFVIFIVGFLYFFIDGIGYSLNMNNPKNSELLKTSKIKSGLDMDGSLKIFMSVDSERLSDYSPYLGSTIISENKMIIGFHEAKMMQDEKLFSSIGDNIEDFFGIDVSVSGIVRKTNSIIDHLHFLSSEDFDRISGDDGLVFLKFLGVEPKVFYHVSIENISLLNLKYLEGNSELYRKLIIGSKEYQPVILGFDEAKMMQDEKLIQSIGDKIDNFFGKDIFISGILVKTNFSIDMMHIVPFGPDYLNG